ncbi:maleylpyruvate isomerase family mycothiol-dependent enzyme [Kitasatospora sp. NBC_01287]|uniref:maleylpyruvate isomerase family mycothiol-dependent enzyme n=1 Tax=Kitasatospora sp. NBC_01287 TaxID=2903573 RepID=UPI00225B8BCA|nr:maleylpyruvate isomerase family mycothiol-dependent enzyme [Kitasatospora sp. NBC_01287]MCX4747602.1 maleylpyruvate isomerase family mycothiol-dependent enzyme [Kitasatospora sp. NBC_01287]
MTENQAVQAYTDAWTHSIESIAELVASLPGDSWNRPTECPGWSVRDIVSHVIAVESELLGDPRPIHSLPSDLRHIKDEVSRYLELPVDKRRCHTAPEMTSELEYVIIRRARALRTATTAAEDTVRFPAGPYSFDLPYQRLLQIRVLDVWVHEQDLRRALRLPGNLDSPGAQVTRDLLLRGLPKIVAKEAGAPAGAVVVFDVTGPLEFLRTIRVDENGHGSIDAQISLGPDVQFTLDWETWLRLACGRVRPGALPAGALRIDGDEELAQRVLANFVQTH